MMAQIGDELQSSYKEEWVDSRNYGGEGGESGGDEGNCYTQHTSA